MTWFGAIITSAVGLAAVGGAMPAMAQLSTNPSFEKGPEFDNGWRRVLLASTEIEGWVVDHGNVDIVGTQWQPATGLRSIDLNGNRAGRIYQILDTTPGVEYVVEFALSGNWGGGPTKTLRVTAGAATQLYTVNTASNRGYSMNWASKQFTFTAGGEFTTLRFASQNKGFWGVAIDDVRVSAVPGPGGVALLGLAGVVAGSRRRR